MFLLFYIWSRYTYEIKTHMQNILIAVIISDNQHNLGIEKSQHGAQWNGIVMFTHYIDVLLYVTIIFQILQFRDHNGLFQKLDAHPLKKTWLWKKEKQYPHISLGIIKHFFGRKSNEDMEIPNMSDCF